MSSAVAQKKLSIEEKAAPEKKASAEKEAPLRKTRQRTIKKAPSVGNETFMSVKEEVLALEKEAMIKKERLATGAITAAEAVPENKPEYKPTDYERAVLAKHKQRQIDQRSAPRLKFVEDWRGYRIEVDHPDQEIGHLLVMESLGTTDQDFYNGILARMANFMDLREGDAWQKSTENELNFLMSFIRNDKPKDQNETMLRLDMAITSILGEAFSQDIFRLRQRIYDGVEYRKLNDFPHDEYVKDGQLRLECVMRARKDCARTYVAQLDALMRYRSHGQPSVSVTNVAVGEGSQTIVGTVNVNQTPSNKEVAKQPLALTDEQQPPMTIMSDTRSKEKVVRSCSEDEQ